MKDRLFSLIVRALPRAIPCEVFVPEKAEFGHFSTNVALRLGKELGENPLALARGLAAKIAVRAPSGFFERVEAAPPGFINFWIAQEALQKEFGAIYRKRKVYGRSAEGKGKTVIVEYSSPNIAKPMHVGHLRSTIIGDALANLYAALGYRVIRWNYLGDWGTQFGKLIAAYKLWGDRKKLEQHPIAEMLSLYVRFHEEEKNNANLQAAGREEFRGLERGGKENRKLWRWFRKESLSEFEKIYRTLGVKFDKTIGESFYEKDLAPLVAELLRKRIARESEGALVVPLESFNFPPALIRKSDEGTLYFTRELATLRARLNAFKPHAILYVVANEQSLHFEQLFAAAKILGWTRAKLSHVKFGLVLGEDRKKFATREGKLIPLEDVLREAVDRAYAVVKEKNPSLPEREKRRVADAVGLGAVKYNDLHENRNSDIAFDWDKMLDFSGESGPYLQYTYARLASILRKAGARKRGNVKELHSERDLALIRKILQFPDVVRASAETCFLNDLTRYLYALAVLANQFYETTPILKDENAPQRMARLMLLETVAEVLERGLKLLGIQTVPRI